MKIVSVIGARPQFVKLASLNLALSNYPHIEHILIHTGQHYDHAMSDIFFQEFRIPEPDYNLHVGSGSHALQTAEIMKRLEPTLSHTDPDIILIYGDTNSTVAGGLVAAKMGIPIAHLEAGLRSRNREMPEEINRIVADHLSDYLFAPTHLAVTNLDAEGLRERTLLTGDVMSDLCMLVQKSNKLPQLEFITQNSTAGEYLVATIHRQSNTDDPKRLAKIISELASLDLPVFLVAHPRLISNAAKYNVKLNSGAIQVMAPLSYFEMASAVIGSKGVITDSGGLQKEAYLWGKLCTTLRYETEWSETLNDGWNILCGNLENLNELVKRQKPLLQSFPYFGDGNAGQKVWEHLSNLQLLITK